MRVLVKGVYFGETEGTLAQYLSMLNELTPGKYVLADLAFEQNPEFMANKNELINSERDRRIDNGFDFEGKRYQSRATDRENIAGASQMAFMAMLSGAVEGNYRWADPDNDYQWIASDDSRVTMDAPTVVNFGKTAAGFKQALIFKARNMKDLPELPVDYTADKWWV